MKVKYCSCQKYHNITLDHIFHITYSDFSLSNNKITISHNFIVMYERQGLITGRPKTAGTQSKHEDIISAQFSNALVRGRVK